MLLPIMGPPPLTGDDKKDIATLHRYTTDTVSRLMLILRNIDGDNITAVPSDRLTGIIPGELLPQAELTTAELEGVDPYANVLSGISLLSEEGETE